MSQLQHYDLTRQGVEQRQRALRVERTHGVRRGSRLIQLEIRRSRRAGHTA